MRSSATGNLVRQRVLTYLILLFVSPCLSLILFTRNPWLASDLNTNSYVWFLEFSRTIFQPQSAYYAESILLPLLAKILGATQTLIAYKLLCGLLTICILPIAAIFAQRYFQNLYKTLLFIILFGLSFQYLKFYILGFPDPLTILLFVVAFFPKSWISIVAYMLCAMLSHFSIATLGGIGLVCFLLFSHISTFCFR